MAPQWHALPRKFIVMIIEVFKTNVTRQSEATILVGEIHRRFAHYTANFDLEDCDRILRVKSAIEPVEASPLIRLLDEFGFTGEILPDIPISRPMPFDAPFSAPFQISYIEDKLD